MDVATGLGVRVDNYAKYESGARIPRPDRLVRLSKILGVSYNALCDGVEREFADLLKSHAIGSITGEAGSFSAFTSDVETFGEAYYIVADFFDRGDYNFVAENVPFYEKYLADPNLSTLIELYDIYEDQSGAHSPDHKDGISLRVDYLLTSLAPVIAIKWAFCIAVKKYLERNDCAFILDEAEELAGDIIDRINPLQFFAVKVFVPYLSFIIDAVDLCMNTTIDDFEKAFLFYALTPPDDDEDDPDEADE